MEEGRGKSIATALRALMEEGRGKKEEYWGSTVIVDVTKLIFDEEHLEHTAISVA